MQYVITYHEKVTTTSLLVAQKFGKEHKNVLLAINNISQECTPEFWRLNFEPSTYESRGKKYPMYIITRDGFTMLMMAFQGRAAAKFREEFIDEFNRMEQVLKQGKTPVLIATYQKRILSEPTKSCPDSHWNIFDASHSILLFIEKHVGSINKYDLADGSIGIHWSKYRKDKPWAVECSTYTHEYEDNRGKQQCKCYQHSESEYFRKWLRDVYKTVHLYDYLHSKYAGEKNRIMLDKVEALQVKLINVA